MHAYVATRIDRAKVTAYLAVIATAVFLAVGAALQAAGIRLPFWLSSPGVFAFFTGMFLTYDRVLWRTTARGRRMSPVPDLNGYWEGYVTIEGGQRRPEEGLDRIPCLVVIEQTWSRMLVAFETEFTRSDSLSATVVGPSEMNSGLRFEYRARAKPSRQYADPIVEHSGFARLEPHALRNWDDLRGEFFSDRSYFRYGQFAIRRLPGRSDAPPWERELPRPQV